MKPREFTFNHPRGLRIDRSTSEQSSAGTNGVSIRDMGNGFVWHDLPVQRTEDGDVSMSLGFLAGALASITLVVTDSSKKPGGWDQWNEADERRHAKRSGEWLAKRGFAVGTYPWGEVWAGYDARGGFGSAAIRFKQPGTPVGTHDEQDHH